MENPETSMSGTQTYIFECNRINSIGVEGAGENFNNQSSWINKVPNTILRQGDNISLQNCLINVAGADTNSIQFEGIETKDGSGILDNETKLKIGFYVNHTGNYSVPMPLHYNTKGTPTEQRSLPINTNKTIQTGINNKFGFFEDTQIFTDTNEANDIGVSRIDEIKGNSRYIKIDGKKYAKIHPNWGGPFRYATNGYLGSPYTAELLEEDILIKLKQGFLTPDNVSQIITETLSKTYDVLDDNEKSLELAIANLYKQDAITGNPPPVDPANQRIIKQLKLNGLSYKTVDANLQKTDTGTFTSNNETFPNRHRIYSNLCVDDPFLWKYGTQLIQSTQTFNMSNNDWITDPSYTVDFPAFIYNRFIGTDPSQKTTPTDTDPRGEYSLYSPFKTVVENTNTGTDSILTTSGFNSYYSGFNDIFRNVFSTSGGQQAQGGYTFPVGSNQLKFYHFQSAGDGMKCTDAKGQVAQFTYNCGLFIDNDAPNYTDIIAWNRLLRFNRNFTVDEHNIFIDTLSGLNGAYTFSPADANLYYSNDFGVGDRIYFESQNAGTEGYKYLLNIHNDPEGIVEGSEYIITFDASRQDGNAGQWPVVFRFGTQNVGYSDPNTGTEYLQVNNDGSYSMEWTASASSTSAGALYMAGYNSFSNAGFLYKIDNIRILRKYTETDDEYSVSNVWTSNYTNIDQNKFYRVSKNGSTTSYYMDLTNNNSPSQPAGIDFNKVYKVITTGIVGNPLGGTLSFITRQAGHDPDVAVLMDNSDPNFTYWIFKRYGYFTESNAYWWGYATEKYNGGIPQSGTIIGNIVGSPVYVKLPSRNGQQFYSLESITWGEVSPYIDFELGNGPSGWNTSPGGGGNAYECFNVVRQELTITKYIYNLEDGNDWVGNSNYIYTFEDIEGTTANGLSYNSILRIKDVNPPQPVLLTFYMQTQGIDGLSGIYEYNNNTVGNTWTLSTTGGTSGFGVMQFQGAIQSPINSAGQLTSSSNDFIYDYHFDGTPNGVPHDIHLKVDTTGDYKNGTYELYLNNNTIFQPDTGAGTWDYDDTQGSITFTPTSGGGFTLYQQNINPGNTTAEIDLNITKQDLNNPPTLPWDAGRPYYFSFTRTGINKTYYVALSLADPKPLNELNGLQGVIYTAGGAQNEGSWTLSVTGAGSIFNCNIANDTFTLNYSSPISLTSEVFYSVNQVLSTYGRAVIPTDGFMYGGGYSFYGTTNYDATFTNAPVYYLGAETLDYGDSINLNTGVVFNNINDTTPNGKTWELDEVNGKWEIIIKDEDDELEISMYADILYNDRYGWQLFRCDKVDNFSNPETTLNNVINLGYFGSDAQTVVDGLVSPNTTTDGDRGKGISYNFFNDDSTARDTGLIKYFSNAQLNTETANIKKNDLLLTNIKFNLSNIKIIENFFRYNEYYTGTKTQRTTILSDIDNFTINIDVHRTDDNKIDKANKKNTDNETGSEGLVPEYMYFKGQLGEDDSNSGGSGENNGVVFPRKNTNNKEQRLKIFTRWKDDFNTRINTGNSLDFEFCYGRSYSLSEFQKDEPDLYDYVSSNNIGVFPVKDKYGNLMCGFEVFEDFDTDGCFKIQNLSYFGFSPSMNDHNYITLLNNEAPAIKPSDYNFTGIIADQMNYIQIGSSQPTMEYNDAFSKFQFSYFHTPNRFNPVTGTEANLSQEVAQYYDISGNDFENFIIFENEGQQTGFQNMGIKDSYAGIYLIDNYWKSLQERDILMTPDNYYNTLFYKLGFSYYDLKPMKFKQNSFNSRFNTLSYNNITDTNLRVDGVSPFTTNSFVSINNAPYANIYSINSGTPDTAFQFPGQTKFGLGFNNNQEVAFQVQSAKLSSSSIPVNISSGYFRIYTDLPLSTLDYSAQNSNLNCIGYALLNYASSNQYFYSYALDFGATITKDINITNIRVEIRNDRGQLVQGLGDKCSVVFKVVRNILLSPPPKDPVLEELEDIDKTLKDTEKQDEFNEKLNRKGEDLQERVGVEVDENVRDFVENTLITIVQNIGAKTEVDVSAKPANGLRRFSKGLANYWAKNRKRIEQFNTALTVKDLKNISKNPEVMKIIDDLNDYYINAKGEAMKGSKAKAEENIYITAEGAGMIIDTMIKSVDEGRQKRFNIRDIEANVYDTLEALYEGDEVYVEGDDLKQMPQAEVVSPVKSGGGSATPTVKKLKQKGYSRQARIIIDRILDLDAESFLRLYLKLTQTDIDRIDMKEVQRLKQTMDKSFYDGNFSAFRNTINKFKSFFESELDTGARSGDVNLGNERKIDFINKQLQTLKQEKDITTLTSPAKIRRRKRTKKQIEEGKEPSPLEETEMMGAEDKPTQGKGRPSKRLLQEREMARRGQIKGKAFLEQRERAEMAGEERPVMKSQKERLQERIKQQRQKEKQGGGK